MDAGYLAEDLVRGALLDGISCSEHQLRMVGDTEMRGVLGIGSTFEAKSVADAIRDGISDMAFEGKLQSIYTTWNYSLSHDLEIAEALLRSRRREFWLALGIAAATALLFLSVWQALRIKQQRIHSSLRNG